METRSKTKSKKGTIEKMDKVVDENDKGKNAMKRGKQNDTSSLDLSPSVKSPASKVMGLDGLPEMNSIEDEVFLYDPKKDCNTGFQFFFNFCFN